MSDVLKNLYKSDGKLHNFFDVDTPVDLFRGAKDDQKFPLMTPTIIGWITGGGVRPPDVLIEDRAGNTPQYVGGQATETAKIVTEDKHKPLTSQIVSDASAYVLKGCRSTKKHEHHRGVSVFDATRPFRQMSWYRIPAGTPIPPALAVTKDAEFSKNGEPIHYTIAPKDDMPLSLFLQHLKGLEAVASKV